MSRSSAMNFKRLFLMAASMALAACVSQNTLVASQGSSAPARPTTNIIVSPASTGPRNVSKTVLANTKTTIGKMYALNPDCSPQETPTIHMIQPPAHGTFTTTAIEDYPNYAATSPRAVCNKQKAVGVALVYTPEKDFKGIDAFTYDEFGSAGKVATYTITVTVE